MLDVCLCFSTKTEKALTGERKKGGGKQKGNIEICRLSACRGDEKSMDIFITSKVCLSLPSFWRTRLSVEENQERQVEFRAFINGWNWLRISVDKIIEWEISVNGNALELLQRKLNLTSGNEMLWIIWNVFWGIKSEMH